MAASSSVIGRTTRIQGRITGSADLEVQGLVEGDIAVGGDLTVDQHGMVGAGVQARRVIVRGAVKGDLVGEEAVLLEDGARVVGDLRAPRIAIAPGALVRGFVQTGEAKAPPRAAAKPVQAVRQAPAAAGKAAPKAVAVAAPAKPAEKPAVGANSPSQAGAPASPRRPPPPVVPVLKKARGQIAKRKER